MISRRDSVKETKSLNHLPEALLGTIMSKLDVVSICSLASASRNLKHCASRALTFLPDFHLLDFCPSIEMLKPLLSPNLHLRSLKINCSKLDDSSIELLIRPSLDEICLYDCHDFNGGLLSAIGQKCPAIRHVYLGSVAEKGGRSIEASDLEELLRGCTHLEELTLKFDISIFMPHNYGNVWELASKSLKRLEVGYMPSSMVTNFLIPFIEPGPSLFPGVQKLCLSVDYITDTMVSTISRGLVSLTYLDLRDSPITELSSWMDLTNAGLQEINHHRKLKHLSLIRSQDYIITYFRRVNDLGMLMLADKCSEMESICLSGFCKVTDTGFKTILHSCSKLCSLKIFHGTHLTDLVFHDISATSLSMTQVCLRWCTLLTNNAIKNLALNSTLLRLDLRGCRNVGDEALGAISTLSELKKLQLDCTDVSDKGIAHLKKSSLLFLSLRGCKRLTDKCISGLFDGSSNTKMRELDLSSLPYLSDDGIISLARSHVALLKLRLRQCPYVGDTSVIALASMQVRGERFHGSSLQLLDVYNSGGITPMAFRWLKKPYFPKLKWLGVTGIIHRDAVDALTKSRPYLNVASDGQELDTHEWTSLDAHWHAHYHYHNHFDNSIFPGHPP